jgi:hypothetical protein
MLKKLISGCLVAFALVSAGVGCRTSAGVRTAHHSVGASTGVH